MRILSKEVTPARVREYTAAKAYQARTRLRSARKPISYIRHPGEYFARRRAARDLTYTRGVLEARHNLIETGYSNADSLVNRSMLKELQDLGRQRLEEKKTTTSKAISESKAFWHDLTIKDDFRSDSILLRHALQPEIIAAVSAVFGQIPHLTILELANTLPSPDNDWRASQRWHRDYGDRQTIKLFTYLTDVSGPEKGPLAYIPKNAQGQKSLPRFPIHKGDAMLDHVGLLSHKREAAGPAGTSFLIDTHNCFHCGSRISPGSERLAFIATYNTFASYIDYHNGVTVVGALSEIDRLVLRL